MYYRCTGCNNAFKLKSGLNAKNEVVKCNWCDKPLVRAERVRTMDMPYNTFRSSNPGDQEASYYELNKKETQFKKLKD